MKLSQRIEQRLASHVPVKPFHMRGTQGVISFTFDDIPRTALTVGGRILNRYGAGGTYYVSGSLTGQKEEGLDCHVLEDIKAAVRDGHEVGSHGYSHVRYSELTDFEIDEDLERNTRFLGDALGEASPISFSYPFGASRLRTKRRLASKFVTARGIRNGINRKMCDLSDLRAHPIFSGQMTEERIRQLIARASETRGWLIFYTHDLSDTPSPWGATPELFEVAVREAAGSGCRILPIRNAIGAVAFKG
jgi:peptidoglycan/xylan/chitin deacetylase (PgdA/CDA1 family)